MKDASNIKYISEMEVEGKVVEVKKPFKIEREERRRFIRLEISAPVSIKNLAEHLRENRRFEDLYEIKGTILNISAAGMLVELQHPVREQDIVLMKFILQDTETMDNVLGLIKRTDHDNEIFLAGIEFLSLDKLKDRLSQAEYDLIDNIAVDFNEQVQKTLNKYLHYEE